MKFLLSGLLCASLGLGEAAAQQVIPPLKKQFLDSAFAVLPSAAGARYRRETEYRDSTATAGEVRDYYLSGQLQSREEFENISAHRQNGVSEYFAENGQLLTHTAFNHGRRTGELRMYYPNGQLKRREYIPADGPSKGESFAPDGQPVPFVAYEVMPRYPEGNGGVRAIIAAIARNFRYPDDARRAGLQGRVLLSFNVTAQGTVADVQVVQPLWPSIDAEAIQAINRLKRFKPGLQDGKPVKVRFTVPIDLKIQ